MIGLGKAVTSKPLTIWAESPEEARNFLARADNTATKLNIERIFVAKRSPRERHNKYTGGEYYTTSNDRAVDTFDEIILAPNSVTGLVQYCTCDIMASFGNEPAFVLEDTTHIVRMNVFQRMPRLIKAANLGVPSIALQGTVGLDLTKRGDRWGLYRYLAVFAALYRRYPDHSPLPLFYSSDGSKIDSEDHAEKIAFGYIDAIISNNKENFSKIRRSVMSNVGTQLRYALEHEPAPELPCIENGSREVTVHIGAKPDRISWIKKGSGQMDPYIGMIAAAKYLYCFDDQGKQIKSLTVSFTYLPNGFPFFKDGKDATALYKRLPFEIADKVVFLGAN